MPRFSPSPYNSPKSADILISRKSGLPMSLAKIPGLKILLPLLLLAGALGCGPSPETARNNSRAAQRENICAAVVRYELQRNRNPAEIFYVSINYHDADEAFLRRFESAPVPVKAMSEAKRRPDPALGTPLRLDDFFWWNDTTVVVRSNYRFGNIANFYSYTLKRRGEDWVVIEKTRADNGGSPRSR